MGVHDDTTPVVPRETLPASRPLPHDGWTSRKLVTGCVGGLLIILIASVMAIWSGNYSPQPWFTADYWVKSMLIAFLWWGFAAGLLTAEKLLQLLQIIVPAWAAIRKGK